MLMNEAAFSAALVKKLREKRWFVQRIESGTTGRGIPDLYVVAPDGSAMWLELKRVHMKVFSKKPSCVNVTWRPGQQNWLRRVHRYGQIACTVIAFDDCFGVVTADKRYEKNIVPTSDIMLFKDMNALVGMVRDRRQR